MINEENYKENNNQPQTEHNEQTTKINEEIIERKKLETEIEQLKIQVQEWKDKAFRLAADVENIRRRLSEEQRLQKEKIEKKIFLDLLPIIDNFDRAIASNRELADKIGLLLIRNLFEKFLTTQGVSEIKEVEQFDPELHEAISQIVDENKISGTIIEVFEKGYRLHNSILRHAKVAVVK